MPRHASINRMPRPPTSEDDAGLARAVASRTAHVVHLTHNDLDAVGADAIHRIKFGKDGVFTVWSSVGKFPGLFSLVASCPGKGDVLSISDLGFHRDGGTGGSRGCPGGLRL